MRSALQPELRGDYEVTAAALDTTESKKVFLFQLDWRIKTRFESMNNSQGQNRRKSSIIA